MKHTRLILLLFFFVLVVCPTDFFPNTSSNFVGRIEGQVYDEQRNPVPDAFVELANEVGSMIGSTKTSPNGRFSFFGVSSGTFKVTVRPYGKNLLEQSQDVLVPRSGLGRAETAFVEFYLRVDKRNTVVLKEMPPDAIFVQEVPSESRKAFVSGVRYLENGDQGGLVMLEEAIKGYPTYFDALNRLGREYIARKQYEKGYPFLLRAIDVNPRSYSSFYDMAYAFYQLKQLEAATKAAEACIQINGGISEGHLLYGILQRLNGDYKAAEASLLKAKSLTKKPNPEIYLQLALTYNRLDRNADAADNLEQYLKLVPNSPDKKAIRSNIDKLRSKG